MPNPFEKAVTSLLTDNPLARRALGTTSSVLSQTPMQNTLTLGRGLLDATPAGDVLAIGEGIRDRSPLGIGLGAASLMVPGTIKPKSVEKLTEVLFHGTNKDFDKFTEGATWFGSEDVANAFTGGSRRGGQRASGARIIPARLQGNIVKTDLPSNLGVKPSELDGFLSRLGVKDVNKFKKRVLDRNMKTIPADEIPADSMGIARTIRGNADTIRELEALDIPKQAFSYFDNKAFTDQLIDEGIDGVEMLHGGVKQKFDAVGRIIGQEPTKGKAVAIFDPKNIREGLK